jgi:ferredoxin-NADP reductase
MLEAVLARLNRWALKHLGRDWVDYVASNTMTDFNRRWNDFIWTYELKAIVVAVRDEAPGVKTFTLMPNQRWKEPLAGQHIALTAEVGGERVSRYYSLSPMEDDCFTITVRRVDGGKLTPWLHTQLKPGMVVDIGQAQGHFCYQQQSKVLFIAAGSGITPCYSMIKSQMGQHVRPDMALYAQFRTGEDVIYKSLWPDWRTSGLDVQLALDYPTAADTASGKFAPALTAGNIGTLIPDFMERDIYMCGPQGFMDKVAGILKAKGYDMARLDMERFVAPTLHRLAPEDFKAAEAEVYFQHLDKRVQLTEADQGRTLMEIAEAHKVHIEIGCRQGMCGTCKLTLREGEVSGNTLGKAVYLCTAYPASTCVVLDA